MKPIVNIFWFRRDLRLFDNTGLYHALKDGIPVLPLFIFDSNILNELEDKGDRRVQFIHDTLVDIQTGLNKIGSSLDVRFGKPMEVFIDLLNEYEIKKVFTNRDYEPYATTRDEKINNYLKNYNVPFRSFKDHVIFEKDEIAKADGKPYSIFTPYAKKWKALLTDTHLSTYQDNNLQHNFFKQSPKKIISLTALGFYSTQFDFPLKNLNKDIIEHYTALRNIPSLPGTSRLSVHLRFGTISIRQLAVQARLINETFLNELVWRDFYQMILWHYPQVVSESFKPAYDKINWRNNNKEFEAWCIGQTGYPIVDAGMRELNETGFMHNRVRMIVASFLTKHLLIDWRWGEAYFAKKLLDYDLAANNGGWQWAAGSGCDAAPYFRIFNPYLQTKKFDPEFKYIKKWVPEFESFTYPAPLVIHETARERCLAVYSAALKKN